MANFNWPSITTTSGPIQFVKDGSTVQVNENTSTPANSTPLPVKVLGPSGTPVDIQAQLQEINDELDDQTNLLTSIEGVDFATEDTLNALGAVVSNIYDDMATAAKQDSLQTVVAKEAKQDTMITALGTLATQATLAATNVLVGAVNETAPASDTASSGLNGRLQRIAQRITSLIALLPVSLGQKTGANSLAVVLASDQGALPASQIPAATGSFAQIANLVATAQSFTAPAGAVGFKIQAPSTNSENIAFSIGSTATITAGILMEPGRSEDFDTGSNISVIATNATAQTVSVLWRIRP